MKKLLITGLALCMGLFNLFAQPRQITGNVTSAEDKQPIPGVSVIIEGTANGTILGLRK